jgi:hypothetical protein
MMTEEGFNAKTQRREEFLTTDYLLHWPLIMRMDMDKTNSAREDFCWWSAASRRALSVMLAAALVLGGCEKKEAMGLHKDQPPHGGTPVALGENYHIEFVLDVESGTLSAYILDDEMEEFVRSNMPSFEVAVKVGGAEQTLVFKPVANPATGETVGDTALFTAQAGWLKTTKVFDAVIKSVTLDGTTFTNVTFNFPKGSLRISDFKSQISDSRP